MDGRMENSVDGITHKQEVLNFDKKQQVKFILIFPWKILRSKSRQDMTWLDTLQKNRLGPDVHYNSVFLWHFCLFIPPPPSPPLPPPPIV